MKYDINVNFESKDFGINSSKWEFSLFILAFHVHVHAL